MDAHLAFCGGRSLSTPAKSLRRAISRTALADWKPSHDRPDPVEVLRQQEAARIPELVPVRHARMLASPFGFFRGAAAIMAADLATVPITGMRVQLCGDAHLVNFGGYGTPERNLIFDVNDFDETLPGPWEWDVLRLAASIEIAGQEHGVRRDRRDDAIFGAMRKYRTDMRRYALMSPLEVWYSRVDVASIAALADAHMKDPSEDALHLVNNKTGSLRLDENPHLIEHFDDADDRAVRLREVMRRYRESLPAHVGVLIDRYHAVDMAMKVVGVGSVGTRCYVMLCLAEDDEPLVLQVKEADASVLEAYLTPSAMPNHGERVVAGQRLMQAASDLFLGWTSFDGHDFYIRQLHDMKVSVNLAMLGVPAFISYAVDCGAALSRAHARSGEPAAIGGYLGRSAVFEETMIRFARTYGKQNARDYKAFVKAMHAPAK
jgi:uncharacterized protein (DUF2252 family)